MGVNDAWSPVSTYHRENISDEGLRKVNSAATAEFDISPGTHSLLRWHNVAYKLLEKVPSLPCPLSQKELVG
jgi:hypothetical protein